MKLGGLDPAPAGPEAYLRRGLNVTDHRFRPPMDDEDAFWLRFMALEQTVDELKRMAEVQANVSADLSELYTDGKAVVRVLNIAGATAVWIAKVGAAVAAIWLAVKGFGLFILGVKP